MSPAGAVGAAGALGTALAGLKVGVTIFFVLYGTRLIEGGLSLIENDHRRRRVEFVIRDPGVRDGPELLGAMGRRAGVNVGELGGHVLHDAHVLQRLLRRGPRFGQHRGRRILGLDGLTQGIALGGCCVHVGHGCALSC